MPYNRSEKIFTAYSFVPYKNTSSDSDVIHYIDSHLNIQILAVIYKYKYRYGKMKTSYTGL